MATIEVLDDGSTVYDSVATPKITISRDADGFLHAVIEVDGLEPQRGTTPEERLDGISSLDPPTVDAVDERALIDLSVRAVQAAVTSTVGLAVDLQKEPGEGVSAAVGAQVGPGAVLTSGQRTASGMRNALRSIGVAI